MLAYITDIRPLSLPSCCECTYRQTKPRGQTSCCLLHPLVVHPATLPFEQCSTPKPPGLLSTPVSVPSISPRSFLLALLGVALFLFTARGRKGGKWRRGTRVKRPPFHSSGDSVSLSNGEELFEPRFLPPTPPLVLLSTVWRKEEEEEHRGVILLPWVRARFHPRCRLFPFLSFFLQSAAKNAGIHAY